MLNRKLEMGVPEFRLLLDDYISDRPEWPKVTKGIVNAFDKQTVLAERLTGPRKKFNLHNGPKKTDKNNLIGFKLDDIFEVCTKRLKRTNGEGVFYVFNLVKHGMDKLGQKTGKSYDFNIYENLTPNMADAMVVLMATYDVAPCDLLALSELKKLKAATANVDLPSFQYDLSLLGKEM